MLKRDNFLREHIENNSFKYIWGVILFLAGVCIGVSVMKGIGAEKEGKLVSFFAQAVKASEGNFASSYKSCLLTNLRYTAACFLLSLTVYTAWLTAAVSAVKGFTVGFTSAFLIKNYGINGVIYTLFAIAPSLLLMLPLLLFMAVVCINFASERRRTSSKGAGEAFKILPPLALIYCIMAVCSLYDGAIATLIFKSLF